MERAMDIATKRVKAPRRKKTPEELAQMRRRTRYCSFKSAFAPSVESWDIWTQMGIQELTWFPEDETLFRVILVSSRCLSKPSWHDVMVAYKGFDMDMGVSNKNRTPFIKYMTPQNREYMRTNMIKCPTPKELVPTPPLLVCAELQDEASNGSFRTIDDFLESSYDPTVDLFKMAELFFGKDWLTPVVARLGSSPLVLDVHQRTLRLERYLAQRLDRYQAEYAELLELKKAVVAPRYPVIDAVTLIVPLMVYASQNPRTFLQDFADLHANRLRAAIESTRDMALVYVKICAKCCIPVEQILLPAGFNWDYDRVGACDTLQHRIDKELRMMQKYASQHSSLWVVHYNSVVSAAKRRFAQDTWDNDSTVYLDKVHRMDLYVQPTMGVHS